MENMPARIIPPFTINNITTLRDGAFLVIINAIMDITTAVPPNAIPVMLH